ncbi:hypothetical protein [Rubricoccus marinus]|uniref:Uncharacterized protein n=1 Tax=Rubricoccus marinus TaxID=716817 RepID=A0A259TUN1_9BACT|nr:hypothetical protein [Rubricoccus marinus]OZC01441.1 hypothetical protein BSZ36_17340 [Rubricoccus marinus]
MSTTPDVPIDDLPERYRSLLVRFDAVRPDCARVARLAIARGERTSQPYDAAFLASLVERAERQTPADPSQRTPVKPEPYTEADLRRHVEGTFRRPAGLWHALTESEPHVVPTVLDLVAQLIGRLASWGLHGRDVRASTRGPEGEQPPSDYGRAVGKLTTGAARLAKDLADQKAGRDSDGTARRLARDQAAFESAVQAARRLLRGGPLVLPTAPVERVGTYRSWWAVTGGPGAPRGKRFGIKHGSVSKRFAERDDVLGPFPTKRAATDAAKRAVATPDDCRIGLFASP